MMKRLLLLMGLGLASGCATSPDPSEALRADGVHLRHLRIRVKPDQTQEFEAIMKTCAAVATARGLADEAIDWMCYREPPGRYWLLSFGKPPNPFPVPGGLDGLVGFMAERDPAIHNELTQRLARLQYEVEWELVAQQKAEWSTIAERNPATHPVARMMFRTIASGRTDDFSHALERRTQFFAELGYPLPVEGFVTRRGADPSVVFQFVFPRDWSSFYERESFGAFVKALPAAPRADYAKRKAALMSTMIDADWYHGTYAKDLSFGW